MAWFRFDRPFDWSPKTRPMVTIAYPVGEFSVTRACEKAAKVAGAGESIPSPRRGDRAEA